MSTNPIATIQKKASSLKTRHLVQTLLFFVTLSLGVRFYLFVRQASGNGQITMIRPAGVEGFLPIGALLSWKRFLFTGEWDFIHPAAMVLFGFAILLSFAFRKAFCAWICPIGTLSEWIWKLGKRWLGYSLTLPKWLDIPLRSIKYLLLGFFLWVVATMSIGAITLFIEGPYYKISDVKMLRFFTHMSTTTAVVLVVLTVSSLFVKNVWCRYLCPYGALTGLAGALGCSRIFRKTETCIHCKKCSEVCPHSITVHKKTSVLSPECSACMDCVDICPVNHTLRLQTGFPPLQQIWSARSFGIMISLIFAISIILAMYLGVWDTRLPEAEFKKLLRLVNSPLLTHPSF